MVPAGPRAWVRPGVRSNLCATASCCESGRSCSRSTSNGTRRYGRTCCRRCEQTGWERYSLFARPDGLIVGYLEAEDLAAAQRAIAATEANTRWQRDMRRFFVSVDGQAHAGDLVLLEPIFNLDDQLTAIVEKAGSETNGS